LPSWPIANPWVSFVAAFLLLDFLHYAAHRCQHAVPWLRRFHALHHSDPDVDVTTSVRHHPIEYLIAAGLYWLAVLMFGIPVSVLTMRALAVFGAVRHYAREYSFSRVVGARVATGGDHP
jgi:sterol desaturase/sphingolipid hydroxylase (fatty acid hydroxylase superfamily)